VVSLTSPPIDWSNALLRAAIPAWTPTLVPVSLTTETQRTGHLPQRLIGHIVPPSKRSTQVGFRK
jgi:hypothetical protein